MELKPIDKREKGQVGIGTLIVFIAMVLVAAIAAGVLINTAGFLQSSAEQTGQESSDQVTNQIQVATKVGLVAGSGATDSIVFDSTGGSGTLLTIDNSSTVTVNDPGGDNNAESFTLTATDGSTITADEIAIEDGTELKFERSGSASVTVTSVSTGASFTMSTDNDLHVSTGGTAGDGDDFTLQRTFSTPSGEVTLETLALTDAAAGSGTDLPLFLDQTTESHLVLTGSSDSINVNDGETLTVTSAGSGAELSPGGSGSIGVSANEEVTFTVDSDSDVTITNDDTGATVTFDATGNGIESVSQAIELENSDGDTISVSSAGNEFYGLASGDVVSGYTVSGDATSGNDETLLLNQDFTAAGGGVSELNIIAIKGSGADQINMEETTITTIGPDGTNTLTYSSDGATQGETYAVEAIQDDDDSLPVMTDSDRFRIVVDPGTLASGETMTLEVTTESGSTTEIRVSVPNTLAGETAVQV